MDHQKFREMIALLLYDELSDSERFVMERHLDDCEACRKELAETKKIHTLMRDRKPRISDTDALLAEARSSLHDALMMRRRPSARMWVPYLAAAATFVVGILGGYLAFRVAHQHKNEITMVQEKDIFTRGNVDISDIQFIDNDASDGNVEFTFNATSPVTIKGDINDERVMQALTKVLVTQENPGARLRAVNALTAPLMNQNDQEVKQALIAALKMDDNAGVRSEAFEALKKLPYDNQIKGAYMHVLMYDTNPGLRVEAIKVLELKAQGDQEVLEVFKKKVTTDNNNYIRTRARKILEEVYEQ